MDQLLFFRLEITTLARDVDQMSQFTFRVNRSVLAARMQSEEAHYARAGPVEQPYGPLKDFVESVKRPRDRERDSLGAFQCQCFGSELAQHDVKKRYDRKRDGKRAGVQSHF